MDRAGLDRGWRRVLVTALLVALTGAAQGCVSAEAPAPVGRAVTVRSDDGPRPSVGRGAVVGETQVLTVAHVVGRRQAVWVATFGSRGGLVKARVVRRIPAAPETLVVLELERDEGPLSDLFGFTGFSPDERFEFTSGPRGGAAAADTQDGWTAWSEPGLEPGDSGSPVVDEQGRLVGLVSGRLGPVGVYTRLPEADPKVSLATATSAPRGG